ncbi:NlpC/P60 family protein [Enterococcus alishanensis]|uniref:NlpC/P60 family protein n=1 Tax=Enterococcus alishanensis TaxID=1303817 RepID=UPI002484895F|nr:NlpC/P60 family protein [Enterococcus alishanensis]
MPKYDAVTSKPETSTSMTVDQQKVVNLAIDLAKRNIPYVWGGKTPSGFDCSGLTRYIYLNTVGVNIGDWTVPQESSGKEVSLSSLKPGDLLFWGSRGNTYNVALYIGNGQYVHAPQPGEYVKVANIDWTYFAPSFARRVLSDAPVNRPSTNGQRNNEQFVFRMYNANGGSHHYTTEVSEASGLQDVGWKYEGVGWAAPKTGNNVYRLYNSNNGRHMYTLSAGERDSLVQAGWKYETISWKSGGNIKVYRVYNPNAKGSQESHVYTTSTPEYKNLVNAGWKYEGIAWYALREMQ